MLIDEQLFKQLTFRQWKTALHQDIVYIELFCFDTLHLR